MVADMYAQIGAEIRRRREGLGLSQAQLADKVGVGRTSITMIERGAQAILVHQLLDIAKALKISPDKLLDSIEANEAAGPSRELFQTSEVMELLSGLERSIGRITR
jgi:transcriptional regulator with XRE-family HTH domain